MSTKLPNAQITPSKVRVEINNKDMKKVFSLSKETFNKLLGDWNTTATIKEKSKHKKHGDIYSNFRLANMKGYQNTEPLNEFDRAVFSAMLSEMLAGNKYTTLAIINRNITGKIGDNAELTRKQFKAILASLYKLSCTYLSFDLGDKYTKLGYNNGEAKTFKAERIFWCGSQIANANGKKTNVINFNALPTLYKIACDDNQILRFDPTLLNVPGQKNTPRIIAVKNYVLRRVAEIKAHKMTATITLADVFDKCRLTTLGRNSQLYIRKAITELFEHLKNRAFIKSFTLNKSGNKFTGFSFTYDLKPKPEPDEQPAEQPAEPADKPADPTDNPSDNPSNITNDISTPNSNTPKDNLLTSKPQKTSIRDYRTLLAALWNIAYGITELCLQDYGTFDFSINSHQPAL